LQNPGLTTYCIKLSGDKSFNQGIDGCIIRDNIFVNCSTGHQIIGVAWANNIKIINNNISSNSSFGIDIAYSNYIEIIDNQIDGGTFGIFLMDADYTIMENSLIKNVDKGLFFFQGHDNIISNGNYFLSNGLCIKFQNVANSTIQGNSLLNFSIGILLAVSKGISIIDNDIFTEQIISDENKYGCIVVDRNDLTRIFILKIISPWIFNKIHHNNMCHPIRIGYDSQTEDWFDRSQKEGNYWCDYNGRDRNNDGIGDDDYLISGRSSSKSKDKYPFINPQ